MNSHRHILSRLNAHSPCFSGLKNQRGGALIYILLAIAMVGILTATLLEPSSQQSKPQLAFRLASQIESQVNFIRSAIEECVQTYPGGDPTITPGSGVDAYYTAPYPLETNESHFSGSTLGQTASNQVYHLRCPGNPGVDNNHEPLFGGTTGRFMPPLPKPIEWPWYYRNGRNANHHGLEEHGVLFRLTTNKTDAYIAAAMQMVADKYTDCEADFIDGDGTNGCADGQYCFKYWMIRKSAC